MNTYHLEKPIWDDSDFTKMGWHDATLWSMVADTSAFEFMVDLDYIFEWVNPALGETHFKFWVAPVTMVFENAHDVKIEIESSQGAIEVADLHRKEMGPSPNGKFTEVAYRFECQEGEISVKATSYKLYVRRSPALLNVQSFELPYRGGISFGRTLSDA